MSLAEVITQINMLSADDRDQLLKYLSIRSKPEDIQLEEWEEKLIEESWEQFENSGRKGRAWAEVKNDILKRLK